MYNTISFYRYVDIKEPQNFMEQIRSFCEKNEILGRILIGDEGINGAVSGKNEHIETFKKFIHTSFPELTFREQSFEKNTYHKLVIKVRKEICAFGTKTDIKNTGNHLKPAQLKELYENNKDFVIVDARNDYEFDVGHFKNAIRLPIKTFNEFPKEILKHEELKDKKVVLYCTGGVRCEKASAYMKEQGFKDVSQLDGGIINFVTQFPKQEWKGGLFVFDDRLISDIGDAITTCVHCSKEESQMYNCHNLACDKLYVSCKECKTEMNTTCSNPCKEAPNQRKIIIKRTQVGVVENYYAKNGVALVKLQKSLSKNKLIFIKGKTTHFSQKIIHLHDGDGNELNSSNEGYVTFRVNEKVRKNDLVMV